MDRFDLPRPTRLGDEPWAAICAHRDRLARMAEAEDYAATIGAAKELAESVARVVLDATGQTLSDSANFPTLLATAQNMLGQRSSKVDGHGSLRTVISSASKMLQAANEIRNDIGTGHGRSQLPDVPAATAVAMTDACLLWSRWVLTILEPVLDQDVNQLIGVLNGWPTMDELVPAFAKYRLTEQLPPAQRSLGVAVGVRIRGGFGNAMRVGFPDGADEEKDLTRWPADYRLGLVRGLLISSRINVAESVARLVVCAVRPLTDTRSADLLNDIVDELRAAPLATAASENSGSWDAIDALRAEAKLLTKKPRAQVVALADALDEKLGPRPEWAVDEEAEEV